MKRVLTICSLVLFLSFPSLAQQLADPEFNTNVANTAYNKSGPRLMFFETHHNFHTANSEPRNPSVLIFSRDNKLLATHPISEGRNQNERLNKVESFTGQSLKGPDDSVAILKLSDTAKDTPNRDANESVSAAGRA